MGSRWFEMWESLRAGEGEAQVRGMGVCGAGGETPPELARRGRLRYGGPRVTSEPVQQARE